MHDEDERPGAWRRPRTPPRFPRDLIIAVVVCGIEFGISHHGPPSCFANHCVTGLQHSSVSRTRLTDGWDDVLYICAAAALLLRRPLPRVALAAIAALMTADALLGQVAAPMAPALVVAFATVVVGGDRLAVWSAIAWGAVIWLPLSLGLRQTPGPAAWLIMVGFGTEVVRNRRGRVAAQRLSREEASLRRVEEERLRIARELHDVLAHDISLINVQSGVALHLLDERPEQARTALSIINEASGDALRELRAVLGTLRRVDEQAPRRPTAGLERLEDLVANAAAAGIEVHTQTEGEARPLPTPVDLAAYRIVQESLTNVARHGGGRATVSLAYGPEALGIEVADDGSGTVVGSASGNGAPGPGSGNGILGMRERATALGGELDAGPRAGTSGFRVRARLPYGETR